MKQLPTFGLVELMSNRPSAVACEFIAELMRELQQELTYLPLNPRRMERPWEEFEFGGYYGLVADGLRSGVLTFPTSFEGEEVLIDRRTPLDELMAKEEEGAQV